MTRYASRVDTNHGDIKRVLIRARCAVHDTSRAGEGFPDLVVWTPFLRRTVLLEVKDGSKPPSKRTLTPEQARWHREWPGEDHFVVSTIEEALKACGVV